MWWCVGKCDSADGVAQGSAGSVVLLRCVCVCVYGEGGESRERGEHGKAVG